MLPILVLVGTFAAAWYMLIVRPQRAQQGQHTSLIGQLKAGDHVMTVGGIFGRIETIDGGTVVLEIAPGMQTRVATDGIARIVRGPVGNSPAPVPTQPFPQPVSVHQPEPQAVHHVVPQQGYIQQFAAPAQFAPAVHGQPQQFTFRAQVAPPSAHMAPVLMTPPQPQYEQVYTTAPAAQYAHPQAYSQPSPPMAGFTPRPWTINDGHQLASTSAQPLGQYHQGGSMLGYVPGPPVQQAVEAPAFQLTPSVAPLQYALPGHMEHHGSHTHVVPGVGVVHHEPPAHRRSSAPQGMGQGAQLDGELRQVFDRARRERAELADEYRREVAPLVQIGGPPPPHSASPVSRQQFAPTPLPAPQLFTTVASPQRELPAGAAYPAPAHLPQIEAGGGMPRPGIHTHVGTVVDEAHSPAFQRPTPYAPQRKLASTAR